MTKSQKETKEDCKYVEITHSIRKEGKTIRRDDFG